MKNKITENLGWKILALLISCALWLVVVNHEDPVISYTFSGIPVEVINGEALTTKGKVYEIKEGSDSISVTLTGKRSIVESISKENVKAVADINDLTLMDTVEIKVSTNKNFNQLDSVKSDVTALELNIENQSIVHLPINVVPSGEPAANYIVGDISSNQNTVRVSGPESVVSKILKAECVVDVNNRISDITTTVDILLYDENGVVITHPNISTNIKSINVSVGILETKAVEIMYSYSGTPMEGYAVSGSITGDRKAVYLAGKAAVLDNMQMLSVPSVAVNVDGKDATYSTVVYLDRYLPEGVRFADADFDGKVQVTVPIEKMITKTFNVPMSNIKMLGIPEGYAASMYVNNDSTSEGDDNKKVMLKVPTQGISENYANVTGDNITGILDLGKYMELKGMTSLAEGVYQIEIVYSLPQGITLTENCYADVKIAEKEEDEVN